MIDLSPGLDTRIQITPRLLVRAVPDGAVVMLAAGDAFHDEPHVVRVNQVVHDVLRALALPRTTTTLIEYLQVDHPGHNAPSRDVNGIIAEVVSELFERGWAQEC